MSKQDIRVKDGHRWQATPKQVYASASTISAGEWVVTDGSHVGYVVEASDGASTAVVHVGLAVSNSTNDASNNGVVYVVDAEDAKFVAKPKLASAWSAALRNTLCVLDVTSGVHTLDLATATNGAFLIEDYDSARNEVTFSRKKSAGLGV